MRKRTRVALLVGACLLVTMQPAYAVIPSLFSPLQALVAVLPQLLVALGAMLAMVFSVRTWRLAFGRVLHAIRTHKLITAGVLVACVVAYAAIAIGLNAGSQAHGKPPGPAAPATTRTRVPVAPEPWLCFRANAARTGTADDSEPPARPTLLWAFKDKERSVADFSSSPAVDGGRVYIGEAHGSIFTSGGSVYCLDLATGTQRWRADVGQQVFSSPVVAGGKVLCGEGLHHNQDSALRCLDAATGKELWKIETKSHVESSPFLVGDRVYFGAGADGVYCARLATGEVVWHHTGPHVDVAPVVAEGRVYAGSGYDEIVAFCLDARTGKRLWEQKTPYPAWGVPSVAHGLVFTAAGNGDFVASAERPAGVALCYATLNGKEQWRRELPDGVFTALAAANGLVYLGCRDGHLYALDMASGEIKWKHKTGDAVVASPVVTARSVIVGSTDGRLYCLDAATGARRWTWDTEAAGKRDKIISSPALYRGKLVFGTSAGYVICLADTVP